MTGFEWAAIGLILFGMAIPFWVITILTIIALEQERKRRAPPSRPIQVHDYAELMRRFAEFLKSGKDGSFNGPTMVAYLRELKEYPQYRDASLLFLEEVSITGSGKFDEICKTEMKLIETHLLGLEND